MNMKRREHTSNNEDAVEVMPMTMKMGTKTTVAEVDVDVAMKDLKTQKVKGDTSSLASPDTQTLSMDVANARNNAAGGKGTSTNAFLVTQQEMKSKVEAPPKAAIVESQKKAESKAIHLRHIQFWPIFSWNLEVLWRACKRHQQHKEME